MTNKNKRINKADIVKYHIWNRMKEQEKSIPEIAKLTGYEMQEVQEFFDR